MPIIIFCHSTPLLLIATALLSNVSYSALTSVKVTKVEGGGGSSNESEVVHPANLCSCPKNLYVLWAKYESGVGGNKPARLFNRAERGKV